LASRQPGDWVTVSSSFGEFRPGQEPLPTVFVATGVGISPFLSILRLLDKVGQASSLSGQPGWLSYVGKAVTCLYGVRYLHDAVKLPLLRKYTDLRLAVSREAVEGHHHGHVTELVSEMPLLENTRYFLCGHDAMVTAVWDQLLARGVNRDHIHAEVFFGIS
jgi:ferredoxin-NADP reductase